jgi:undecaprenyl-diphosphatase
VAAQSRPEADRGDHEEGKFQSPLTWLIASLSLFLAGTALGVVAAGPGTVPGDIEIALTVQRPLSPALDTASWAISRVGDGFPAMVVLTFAVVAFLIWRRRIDLALFVGLAASLRLVGPYLKSLAQSARPPLTPIATLERVDTFGYPSGHALGAALLYGAIAVIAPEVTSNRAVARAIQIAAVAMIVLMALARVRLGVHWPSDVAGGICFGLGLVCLLRAAALFLRQRPIRA